MRSYNRATILGHIGSEIVLRSTKNGTAVVNMNVATNERRANGVDTTVWHRTVLWDKKAEYASRYLSKGDPVYIEGRIGDNAWTDNEGVRHVRKEITVQEIIGLGARRTRPDAGGEHQDDAIRSQAEAIRSQAETPETIRRARQLVERANHFGRPPGQAPDGEELREVSEEIPF